ncbi:MAG: hypothetical protein H6821_02915 [Planctomycetaceae bacterium]|nr:hypothetical protein [Planctomycetales bacterium]MCB9873106.1 hypothetical protein [Planctomycetaceae bacterium]MCB9937786.1 hypothetical protein [Planctomycetaceae bacterium]
MTEADFHVLLIASSFLAVRFGQRYVSQTLPFDFRYDVRLNQSCDDHATPDDVLYPDDNDRVVSCDSESDVVALLFRDGRCPQWIDISAARVGETFTEMRLLCCGRFTNDRDKLYYTRGGTGPFGIKSPVFPPDYKEGTKFLLPQASA